MNIITRQIVNCQTSAGVGVELAVVVDGVDVVDEVPRTPSGNPAALAAAAALARDNSLNFRTSLAKRFLLCKF
jgi:hypothetical protein